MPFDPADASRPAASVWWLYESVLVEPWKTGAKRLVNLLRDRYGARRRTIRLPPVSDEWLRQHETEASKHSEDR